VCRELIRSKVMSVIECMCCVYDRKQSDMGMLPQEDWVPFAFKLKDVVAIREPKDENDRDQTIVFFGFDSFWVDIPYNKLLSIFKSEE
jgi:hypothetical protein